MTGLGAVTGGGDGGREAAADRAGERGGHVGDGRRAGCALADHDEGLGDAVGAGVVGAGGHVRGEHARARAHVGGPTRVLVVQTYRGVEVIVLRGPSSAVERWP